MVATSAGNSKGELIAACRTQGLGDPAFESVSDGPGHAPWFRTVVRLGERELGRGEGRSKRDAERAASAEALRTLLPGTLLPGTLLPGTLLAVTETQPQAQAAPVPLTRWPIYAELLSRALLVAHERNQGGQMAEVAEGAAELYRALLSELGYNPET